MSEAKTGAEQASQAEAAATEAVDEAMEAVTEVIARRDPVSINTDFGAIMVYGHEFMSKAELTLLGHCLTSSDLGGLDHGVRCVVFLNDGYPTKNGKQVKATADVESGVILVNLMHTFSEAMTYCMDDPENNFSIRAIWHHELALSFLHEIHHLSLCANDLEMKSNIVTRDEDTIILAEEMAREWSLAEVYHLAKVADIEPAHIAESAFLSSQVMELLKDDDSDFGKGQRHMLENNILFFKADDDAEHELLLTSFKDVCHRMSGDALDAPEWLAQPAVGDPLQNTMLEQAVAVATPPAPLPDASADAAINPATMVNVGDGVTVDGDTATSEDVEMDTSFADYCDDDNWQPGPAVANMMAAASPAPAAQPSPAVPQPVPAAQPMAGPAQNLQPAQAPPMQPTHQMVYPETGYTPEQTVEIVRGVMDKIVAHFFTMCGRANAYPEYDANFNDGGPIANVQNVFRIGIPLTEPEKAVIVKMDCYDANGKWCPNMPTSSGELRGWVTKQKKLPMYKIYINAGGYEHIRTLVPASPTVGKRAIEAQAGNQITYVMDGQDTADQRHPMKRICENGVWKEIG